MELNISSIKKVKVGSLNSSLILRPKDMFQILPLVKFALVIMFLCLPRKRVDSLSYLILNRVLPEPKLLLASPAVTQLVGWDQSFISSDAFVRFFSGDMEAMKLCSLDPTSNTLQIEKFQSWATPYALSIYGEEMYHNCPFKNGNGYGDGRAISIAEIYNPSTNTRLEFQLKGGGTTPFSRGADGRAVLRSSVREFLASEAMHYLGVETTRALSLIVSGTGFIERPWFSPQKQLSLNDSRLNHYPPELRREVVKYANSQPDVMIQERMTITCRVAASFLRVGHIELFARRYRQALASSSSHNEEVKKRHLELKLIVFHMLFREYPHLLPSPSAASASPSAASASPSGSPQVITSLESLENTVDSNQFQSICLEMLRECSRKICALTASWVRVGYCQGNFNSDNCLVSGRTMDYGPFGFIEKYEKNWNMWTGGGEKYSFRFQHLAGERNFFSLATSISLLFDESGKSEVRNVLIPSHKREAEVAIEQVYRQKLGFQHWESDHKALFQRLDDFMETTEADYTLFWRQLALIPERVASLSSLPSPCPISLTWTEELLSRDVLLEPLSNVFYSPLSLENERVWYEILRDWILLLLKEVNQIPTNLSNLSVAMRRVSPKYVPREWMLIEAYSAAEQWNLEPLQQLQTLFEHPYEEQPQFESKYYQKMSISQLDKGGVTCMT
jgi:uncharacterized protein YdiU (UPF0061 family)